MFCGKCGAENLNHAKFCRECGMAIENKTIASAPMQINNVNTQAPIPQGTLQPETYIRQQIPQPRRSKGKGLLWIVLFLAIISTLIVILTTKKSSPREIENLTLGKAVTIAVERISPKGGEIEIDQKKSPIDGMLLTIPEGAYPDATAFTIQTTDIIEHDFGKNFKPISPLITIDNGHGYAQSPMILHIPISLNDDEFALAFYVQEDGTLEALPLLSENNEEIVVFTCHFSDFVVSKVDVSRIVDDIQTGFTPGADDMIPPNNGTVIAATGHCVGQTFANIVYYMQHVSGRIGWDRELNNILDNNGKGDTPFFYADDALLQRLASAIQKYTLTNWTNTNAAFARYNQDLGVSDLHTYYAFAYAMQLTGMPQMVYLAEKTPKNPKSPVAHAMVIYGLENSKLLVADPNYPGEKREIAYSFGTVDTNKKITGAGFQPYSSAISADAQNNVLFDLFGFFATSALIDVNTVKSVWLDALENEGKEKVDKEFPADPKFVYIAGKDDNGQFRYKTLQPDTQITPDMLSAVSPNAGLFIAPETANPKQRTTVYIGDKALKADMNCGKDTDRWLVIPLQKGSTDLGISVEQEIDAGSLDLLNFYRIQLTLSDALPTPTPAATEAPQAGFGGTWQLTITYLDECKHDGGVTGLQHNLPFVDADHLNKPYSSSVEMVDGQFVATGNTYNITIPSYAGYAFTGTLSADGQQITGTLEGTWGNGAHWIKGTFVLTR